MRDVSHQVAWRMVIYLSKKHNFRKTNRDRERKQHLAEQDEQDYDIKIAAVVQKITRVNEVPPSVLEQGLSAESAVKNLKREFHHCE